MADREDFVFLYHESDFVVSGTTIGKQPSPEHAAILDRARRTQLRQTLARSAARRRKWGLPELSYRPPA
jgi:hypothetical protein